MAQNPQPGIPDVSKQHVICKLNGNNWSTWRFAATLMLTQKRMLPLVLRQEPRPEQVLITKCSIFGLALSFKIFVFWFSLVVALHKLL